MGSTVRLVATAGFFFYVGWWAAHEHYEAVGPDYVHRLLPHFWRLSVPIGLAWLAALASGCRGRFGRIASTLVVPGLAASSSGTLVWAGVAMGEDALVVAGGVCLALTLLWWWSHPEALRLGGPLRRLWSAHHRRARAAACGARIARTQDQLVAMCARAAEEGRSLVVVGGGWSWVLRGLSPPEGACVVVDGTEGRCDGGGEEWWASGTSVGTALSVLAADGRTLAGAPSIATATLGGWVASRSHGSGGTLWTPALGRVRCYDLRERRVVELASAVASSAERRYVILAVELLPVADAVAVREAFDVDCASDARRYLQGPSFLRAIFVTREYATAFVWRPEGEGGVRHSGSLSLPPWLWSLLPASWGRRAWRGAWTRRVRLHRAHAFGPVPPLAGSAFAHGLVVNLELFATVGEGRVLTPETLLRLCDALRCAFEHVRGRCEVRGATLRKVFLDFALTRPVGEGEVRALQEVATSALGPGAKWEWHPGKARPEDL